MNREIKFRGNDLKGNWVYGSLHQGGAFSYILNRENFLERGDMFSLHKPEVHCVDPKSIGEFTGLNDGVNNPIYEGDIYRDTIENEEGDEVLYFVCVKVDELGGFVWMDTNEYQIWLINPEMVVNDEDEPPYHLNKKYCSKIEIIGNIYENPDLLNS